MSGSMPNTVPDQQPRIHVAVGVVINAFNEVLVALRPDNLHQGGLWEFPGGKVEGAETVVSALQREFLEEVNVSIISAEPLMNIHHDYSDKSVYLDVWLCREFTGSAIGLEGQEVRWVDRETLSSMQFPAANAQILETVLSLL